MSFLNLARAQGKVGRIDSAIEATLALQLRDAKLPPWERNYQAIPGRKLETDFAWPRLKFGIEVQGAVHRIETHFHRDAEKAALLLLEGWQLLPVTGRTIRSGQAIVWACQLIKRRADDLGVPLHP